MQSKIIALASAVVLAGAVTIAASTGAKALRLPDDVYYYSTVTRAFGHTPRRDRFAYVWTYAGPVACSVFAAADGDFHGPSPVIPGWGPRVCGPECSQILAPRPFGIS